MLHARQDYQRIQDPENKIPDDEPVFLIRAQDLTASDTVRAWIRNQKKLYKNNPTKDDETKKARKKMLAMAEAHAYRMESWATQKIADMP